MTNKVQASLAGILCIATVEKYPMQTIDTRVVHVDLRRSRDHCPYPLHGRLVKGVQVKVNACCSDHLVDCARQIIREFYYIRVEFNAVKAIVARPTLKIRVERVLRECEFNLERNRTQGNKSLHWLQDTDY